MLQRKVLIVFLMLIFWGYSEGCVKKTKEEYYGNGKLKAIYSYNDKGLLAGVVKKYASLIKFVMQFWFWQFAKHMI